MHWLMRSNEVQELLGFARSQILQAAKHFPVFAAASPFFMFPRDYIMAFHKRGPYTIALYKAAHWFESTAEGRRLTSRVIQTYDNMLDAVCSYPGYISPQDFSKIFGIAPRTFLDWTQETGVFAYDLHESSYFALEDAKKFCPLKIPHQ